MVIFFTTNDILNNIMSAILSSVLNALFQCGKHYYNRSRYNPMICIVIPSGSGKTTVCDKIKSECANDYIVLDIEELTINSLSATDKAQLMLLKTNNDIILYERMLYSFCYMKLLDIRIHLKETKQNLKPILVFISSVNGKRILRAERAKSLYYAPSVKCLETILARVATPQLKAFITFTRESIMAKAESQGFKDAIHLWELIQKDLNLQVKL